MLVTLGLLHQKPVPDQEDGIGFIQIDVARLYRRRVTGRCHRHRRVARQDIGQHACAIGRQMGDHDKRGMGLRRQSFEQRRQCFHATGRGPNGDNREGLVIHAQTQSCQVKPGSVPHLKLADTAISPKDGI